MGKLSGLNFIQKILSGGPPQPPMGLTLGFHLRLAEPGRTVFEGAPTSAHYNPIGSVHGGFASILLDSAMGCAVHTKLPAGIFYTTLELKINLVRAIQENTGMLRATGSVIHCGRRTATVESRLEDRSEQLYAHGTSTCLIFSD